MKNNSPIDTALLLIRVGLALVFIAHGWDKVSDIGQTVTFFSTIHLPAFIAYLIAGVEIVGGILMLLGWFTGWAGILLAADMVGAIGLVKISRGFVGGYEFDLMLFLAALAIALAGPGMYTVKYLFRKQ